MGAEEAIAEGADVMGDRRDKSWHVSKSVNLSVLFALIVQGGAAIWWASGMEGRVEQHYSEMLLRTVDRITDAEVQAALAVRDARIEANSNSITRIEMGIGRIDNKLDRLLERQHDDR